jgi:hypothetical protein
MQTWLFFHFGRCTWWQSAVPWCRDEQLLTQVISVAGFLACNSALLINDLNLVCQVRLRRQ